MTIDKNDPKLTAFVLGELTDEEMREIQSALENNADLKNEVEAIRQTVAEIEATMQSEPIHEPLPEQNISVAKTVDQPKKAEEIKKRRFPLTIVELLVVVSIIGMLAGLMLPATQSARESGRRAKSINEARQAEMDAEASSLTAAEGKPIDGVPLRYESSENAPHEDIRGTEFLADGRKRRDPQNFFEKLSESAKQKNEESFVPVPEESAPVSALAPASTPIPARESRKSDRRFARVVEDGEVSKKKDDQSFYGQAISGSGELDKSGEGSLTLNDSSVNRTPNQSKAGMAGQGRRMDVDGKQAVGGGMMGGGMMMVTPEIIVQEEEEEYLCRIPADPYNSAKDEAYKQFVENEFLKPKDAPFSTFSIDVDTAAYTTMRRYIEMGKRPPVDSVRLEEYVNYFKYDYAQPKDGKPFATHVDVAACPWNSEHLLARIGIKGKEYTVDERPPLNLVFLIDTSGSMEASNRLPLVKRGLTELVEMLQPKDRVAIVTYAGSSRVALPSVSGQEKQAILDSINSLGAGGSTAGAAGIKTAYEVARKYYDKKAQNRVILCTDGDFNVGETNNKTLETMIGEEAQSGVFLTILGFGMGNYKDERLKTLSMRGNGNYGYIDNIEEARRLLVEGLTGTLFAIAKDVKIQVDFNPKRVAGYRLLGYENRKLRDEDFHNDKIDAGEIGAGHTVTALYEIVPVGAVVPTKVDESRYSDKEPEMQRNEISGSDGEKNNELMFVKLRYKQADEDNSSLLEYPVVFDAETKQALSGDAQFAAAVALYGMLLRNSRYSGDGTFDGVLELAEPNTKGDKYRTEFIELVKKAKTLK